MYLPSKHTQDEGRLRGDEETRRRRRCRSGGGPPFKVGDVLVVALAADVDDLGEELVSVGGSFCLVHMEHQLLHDLHQVLFRYLQCKHQQNCQFTALHTT